MKYALIIGALSISFASVYCMEEEELKKNAPPTYYQAPITTSAAATIPQGTDTYMTYREFWDNNKVPQDVRQKSVRAQEEWRAAEIAQKIQQRAQREEAMLEQARKDGEDNGYYKGACVASAFCFVGMKGIWLLIP